MIERVADRGEVSAEATLLVPVLFVVALIAVQAGVVLHGISIANHVASEGAVAAAAYESGISRGSSAAQRAATAVGARLARQPRIDVTSRYVSVRVWIVVPRAVPFFPDQVSRLVTVPRERFIPFGER